MAPIIPEEKISEVRDTCNIVDIVGESVVLKKAGQNYVGLCPFHAEKTPSFTVSPHKQMFYCFGCGAGGNVFSFLMKHQGIAFPDAVRQLAERFGIQLPQRQLSPEQEKRMSERDQMFRLNRVALDFYHHVLQKDAMGQVARQYLKKRGFTPATAATFQFGYAPSGWDHLLRYLRHKRMALPLAERAGLVVRRQSGQGHYDRFRGRIVFPICDPTGRVIAFGGRVLDDALPKYLNSPESDIYSKSRSLYGLDVARHHCRSSEQVYIVEGYFDVSALHQHGICETVGTLGTSLTRDHVRHVKGLIGENGRAYLVFDSDEAGVKAARRSVALFEKGFVDARILVLPPGQDPDSFVFEHGQDQLRKMAAQAKGLMAFLIDSAVELHGMSMEGRIRVVDEMAATLAAISDPGARSIYVKYLAETVDINETAILEKINQSGHRHRQRMSDPGQGGATKAAVRHQMPLQHNSGGNRIERQVVAMILQFPEILPIIREKRVATYIEDPLLKAIAMEATGASTPDEVIGTDHEAKQRILAQLNIQSEKWEYRRCLDIINQLLAPRMRARAAQLDRQIREAEKQNDHERLVALLQERKKLTESRQQMQRAASGVRL